MAETNVNNAFLSGGQMYSLGVADPKNTTARDVGYIFGPVSDTISVVNAALETYSVNGPFHPSGTAAGPLPLQTASATRIDKNIVQLQRNYYYSAGASYPTIPAYNAVDISASTYTFRSWHKSRTTGASDVFDAYGRPEGSINFSDYSTTPAKMGAARTYPPNAINYDMTQTAFYITTVLDYNPYDLVQAREGYINSNNVVFAGVTFLPYTVKFVRCAVKSIQVQDGLRFHVVYTFIARHAYWVDELPPVWDLDTLLWIDPKGSAIPSGNPWYILNTKPISFGSGFPVYL